MDPVDNTKFEDRALPACYHIPEHYQPPPFSELKDNTEYPNLNSEDYRARDPEPDKGLLYFYEHLDQNEDGNFLLATNSYFDRYFTGNVFGFDDFDDIASVDKSKFSVVQAGGTITSLNYISPFLFILTSANSSIELWSTKSAMRNPDGYCLFKIGSSFDFPGVCQDLKLFNNENKAVTGSTFGAIQLWDYGSSDLYPYQTIRSAHPGVVNGISISPTSNQEFVSCSNDRSVLLWDLRSGKPGASAVFEFHETIFTSVRWGTEAENGGLIQASDIGGKILSFDVRVPGKILSVLKVTEGAKLRPIRKFVYNGSNMAVVDHSSTVRIYNKSQEKTMEFSTDGPLIYDFLWDKLDNTLCYAIGERRFYRKLKIEGEKLVES